MMMPNDNNQFANLNMMNQNANNQFGNNMMMPNVNNYQNNSNMDFSLTSNLINGILIKFHPHPLIYCYQIERKNKGITWKCNLCFRDYNWEAPSFYCTYCDFDACRNCLGKFQLDDISISNPCNNFDKNLLAPINSLTSLGVKHESHNHLLDHIKRFNPNFFWRCDICKINYKSDSPSYCCSLCNYDICDNCFEAKNIQGQLGFNAFPPQIPFMPNQLNDSLYKFSVKNYKPVIYLYPEKQMNVRVQMNLNNSKFLAIYPEFNEKNTWNVQANPNGDILFQDKIYPYLFWEAESYSLPESDEGFIVKADNAIKFLEEKLKILGLNNRESTDFITYWIPVLYRNKLSLCTFQSKKYFDNFELNITPKPTTLIRIFLSIKKIDAPIDIKEQKLESIERKGFTAIEWGGCSL